MENGDRYLVSGSSSSSSALIFLGTGCSGGIPDARCLIRPSNPPCQVCSQSLSLPPERNPNYRGNTSLLLDYCQENGKHSYILIDAGKSFRESVLRWFTYHEIDRLDSIILTHEHADAVLGLDDVRSVQEFSPKTVFEPTPVYLTQHTMDSIAMKFPYLVPKKQKEGQIVRRVAQLDWTIVEGDLETPFFASGLKFVPLPVMHGEDYVCLGFLFGEKCKVAYISDVSRIPPPTEYVISKDNGVQLDLLILEANTHSKKGPQSTHMSLSQSLEIIKRICPKQALLVGMTHEFDHHRDNEFLKDWSEREGIPVQLAYDGLRILIDL